MNKRQRKNVSVDGLNYTRRITRSMSLADEKENSLPIQIDLIITIFLKLPLKSIARCRCVCKLWASILRGSDFTELFLSMSCSRGPKLLFAYRSNHHFFVFSSLQPQNPDENSSPIVPNYQLRFSLNGYFEESEYVYGLICLKDSQILKGKKEIVFKICNPSTGQVVMLPKLKTRRNNMCSVFGYDPFGKRFKVLAMTEGRKHGGMCDEFQVLTFGSGKMSWKMIDCVPHNSPQAKICINGVIYYTSIHRPTKTCTIVSFDVRFEKFNFIKTKEIMNKEMLYRTINLINYNGKLGMLLYECCVFSSYGRSLRYKLWVLEDLEKQVWSEHTFLFPNDPKDIVIGRGLLNFVGVTQSNEIVLSTTHPLEPFYLLYLNLEKKTTVRVTIQGSEVPGNGKYLTFLHYVEDLKLYANV